MMGKRIEGVKLENYGPLRTLHCPQFSNLNLFIGDNGQGKTFLLKGLYATIRVMELHGRGDSNEKRNDLLADRLRWTFQFDKLGDLVTKGTDTLKMDLLTSAGLISCSFSSSASVQINSVAGDGGPFEGDSIFVPAKKVLSVVKSGIPCLCAVLLSSSMASCV